MVIGWKLTAAAVAKSAPYISSCLDAYARHVGYLEEVPMPRGGGACSHFGTRSVALDLTKQGGVVLGLFPVSRRHRLPIGFRPTENCEVKACRVGTGVLIVLLV